MWVLEQAWIIGQRLQKTEADRVGEFERGACLWKVLPWEVEAWASGGGTDTVGKIEY